ncbi:Ribonuclease E [Bosea sp. 62]|uniref:Rne/Rng family ribonuclease n=1 Tax=unclassified Bosea (in: a-proteobacteria) TaxID=2653178 RepID=UPI0012542361|nr:MULTISPECIES: ribonuclease E/G [unclassified Bosea (in: a-proteobacteria)]CAD5260341.1 Ribonuclease E [Bosea sp. 46]CAD5264844.1 Ribonuclease E [Bosea sp. 21B]CAD5275480.1 Ribonuclease E [Bosea sp. 7B]VVT59148.1 Ribonuclease E [Bosea sp. EC-HK365B]VXB71417.1 Ribonuclease E [Bosea sp. 29B]
MANKMLIDATHPEETRVVVSRGSRIEEFDFESASRKPLRGNIYLAKVTRVEPSLQAAFVEYGGNRHGFLAFSEIHPDYYQIPVADRQALLAEEARAEREEERDEEKRERRGRRGRRDRDNRPKRSAESGETVSAEVEAGAAQPGDLVETNGKEAAMVNEGAPAFGESFAPEIAESANEDAAENSAPLTFETTAEAPASEDGDDAAEARRPSQDDEDAEENGGDEAQEEPEHLGGGDALDDMPERPRNLRRQYKIQEVIKRRQIILVQVVKEERGNKGAALTTYLSLAGRYSVLMPNTGKGGGISRKITNAEDRKRLKEIAQELEVPEGMGIILRTAGASRTKPEIRRDYEYLMRMWESVRELTLGSVAPALVYEEGNLVKRSIRDLYNKDIDEVHVAGESAYREAKDFMRMLMPSHAKSVKPYREQTPLFAAFGVESQLDAMFSNTVTLKSGGYIVINQTEALVAIDINSGRSTREHNIEDTALKTNLEAAEEISRQLRLRDLAGLIVIDFIDMEENRNNRAVEKKLKECLKNDRARIQVGRISAFGLLEMSRQRIRTGVLESSSVPCPHCAGAGLVRSTPSIALQILRALEEALIKSASHNLEVRTRPEVALYVLNQKRAHLRDLEERFNIAITISADAALLGTRYFEVERGEFVGNENRVVPVSSMRAEAIIDEPEDEDIVEVEVEAEAEIESGAESETAAEPRAAAEGESQESRDGRRRRRRRRRRRGGERDGQDQQGAAEGDDQTESDEDDSGEDENTASAPVAVVAEDATPAVTEAPAAEPEADAKPKRARRGRAKKAEAEVESETVEAPKKAAKEAAKAVESAAESVAEPAEKPKRSRSRKKVVPITEDGVAATPAEVAPAPEPAAPEAVVAPAPEPVVEEAPAPRVVEEPVAVVLTPPDPDRPKRGGWWNKLAGRK